MNSLEKELIWTGFEDYTGLWDFFFLVRDRPPGGRPPQEARELARQLLESFLARGWVELYTSRASADQRVFATVPIEDRSRIMDNDASWTWEDVDLLVWYATTDDGIAAYQEATALLS